MMDPTGKPGPPWRTWCADSREDPVTGLVAFPDFHKRIPAHVAATLRGEGLVGLAIGDVDGLKSHVERVNADDPDCYGHLAGNKVMTRLGMVTREWFHEQLWRSGCVATFGGDEVIVAAALDDAVDFYRSILQLSDRLAGALPVPVSFALAFASADNLPTERSGGWQCLLMDRLLTTVDRCLFLHKAARLACGGQGGTSVITELPLPGQRAALRNRRTLLPLPTAAEELHVLAHPAGPEALGMLLLPCSGPAEPSGSPLRITFPDGSTRTTRPISLHGQAAVRHEAAHFAGPNLPLTLRPMREGSSH
ncbi:GGDEF domain-containing protein [Streptomyces sp. V4I8]